MAARIGDDAGMRTVPPRWVGLLLVVGGVLAIGAGLHPLVWGGLLTGAAALGGDHLLRDLGTGARRRWADHFGAERDDG
jgi:hypothetical protein